MTAPSFPLATEHGELEVTVADKNTIILTARAFSLNRVVYDVRADVHRTGDTFEVRFVSGYRKGAPNVRFTDSARTKFRERALYFGEQAFGMRPELFRLAEEQRTQDDHANLNRQIEHLNAATRTLKAELRRLIDGKSYATWPLDGYHQLEIPKESEIHERRRRR